MLVYRTCDVDTFFSPDIWSIIFWSYKFNVPSHPSSVLFARDRPKFGFGAEDSNLKQESPADARVTRDSAIIPRWPSAAILDIIEPEIAPCDPLTPKTLAQIQT